MRHRRVRAGIIGTPERPRLSVFRSNRHIVVQLIDDQAGATLLFARDEERGAGSGKKTRTPPGLLHRASAVGELLARRAREKGIGWAVFDRGGYAYHGIVRAVAEGARKGGLKF